MSKGAVTKGEFIAFIMRALGIQNYNVTNVNMDFIPESTYKNIVLGAMDKGIVDINLIKGGQFICDSFITREEAASLLVNALEYKDVDIKSKSINDFADAAYISNWAIPYIEKAVGFGLYVGDSNLNFRPQDFVSLQEAAALIMRFVGHI